MPVVVQGENPYRCCLWCNKEIGNDREITSNFCRFNEEGGKANCYDKFKQGITQEKRRELQEANLKKPIRGWVERTTPRERRAKRRADSVTFRICKLGEYKDEEGKSRCDEKGLWPTNKFFCCEPHQVKYNSIKKQERKVARREEAAILKKLL